MTLAAIAWDIDGTLIDSETLHGESLEAICRGLGVDLSDLGEEEFRGIHMHDVWEALRPRFPASLEREVWIGAILDHYVRHAPALTPLPGALEAIATLAARGIPQVCVSNSHRVIVDANLKALGVAPHIAFSISFDDVTAGKPDPEPYALACRRLGLDPGRVLAVEDSRAGAESASAAGLPVALCIDLPEPWPRGARRVAVADIPALFPPG